MKRFMAAVALLVLVAGGACSSPTSSDDSSSVLENQRRATQGQLAEIESNLAGLTGSDRLDALIDLAEKEGGTVDVYGSMNLDEADPVIGAFEDRTDITVNYYRANSEDVLQRLIEESRANFQGADVVVTNGPEMTLLDDNDLLASVETPASDDIVAQGVNPTWVWSHINTFVPTWNTDLVDAKSAPQTWEDVLTNFPGELAMEAGDVDWFATLVKSYLVEEKGMTEDEAIELVRRGASGARAVDGHTLMTELLAAGEFAIAASPYLHRVEQLQKDGAPLEWQPAIEPLIARPNGVGVHATADQPASGLLFMEFLLTEAQGMLLEIDRQPASETVPGGGLPRRYENVVVDVDAVVSEFEKWSELYDEIIRGSGGEVIED